MRTKRFSTFGYYWGGFPIGVAVIGLTVTAVGTHWISRHDAAEIEADAAGEARHVAAQLSVGLSQAFDLVYQIAASRLKDGRPPAPQEWHEEAELILSKKLGLQRLIWLEESGKPVWSAAPDQGPIARPAVPDAALLTALTAAGDTDNTAISGVFEAEGKRLVYVCSPVYRKNRFEGYIAGLFDAAELVESQLEGRLPDSYYVSVVANGTELLPVRRGFTHVQTRAPTVVADATWTVALAPSRARVSPLAQSVTIFGIVISLLLYASASIARVARRRARELAKKNEDFQTLLEVLPIGIVVADDPQCREIWTNRAMAEMLDLPDRKYSPEAYRITRDGVELPADERPMQKAAATRKPVAGEYLDIIRRDGVVRHTLNYAAPLFDEDGQVRGIIDACVDITARKELENRLQQAEKFQSLALMAGGIAHDFNNLLTVIVGNASAAAMHVDGQSRAGRALSEIELAGSRAAELVGKLLAYTGRFWRERSPLALAAEIEFLMPRLREIVPPHISIRAQAEPELPLIEAGSSEVRQVLVNLTMNAVEALEGSEDGQIEIVAARREFTADLLAAMFREELTPGEYVLLEVSDNGCGIPEEIQRRVFDPFFTTKFVGRGLGLSAVHGIVRAHGGAIRLTSSPKRGTRVQAIFPAFGTRPRKPDHVIAAA